MVTGNGYVGTGRPRRSGSRRRRLPRRWFAGTAAAHGCHARRANVFSHVCVHTFRLSRVTSARVVAKRSIGREVAIRQAGVREVPLHAEETEVGSTADRCHAHKAHGARQLHIIGSVSHFQRGAQSFGTQGREMSAYFPRIRSIPTKPSDARLRHRHPTDSIESYVARSLLSFRQRTRPPALDGFTRPSLPDECGWIRNPSPNSSPSAWSFICLSASAAVGRCFGPSKSRRLGEPIRHLSARRCRCQRMLRDLRSGRNPITGRRNDFPSRAACRCNNILSSRCDAAADSGIRAAAQLGRGDHTNWHFLVSADTRLQVHRHL
ncbi:hypothetical protein SAMN04490220_0486 [Rhodococcus jostii]|uniref:Uncharacterized protein n=1 Tax=Rhodococcus jostii TaxID=132919 RepID=A0A1H4ISX9_RHOJO|nr:hypothetical protein SAMN04490220_0486 [Rhodococcus jostii]